MTNEDARQLVAIDRQTTSSEMSRFDRAAAIAALPPHLGWENPRFAEHMRQITNVEGRRSNEEAERPCDSSRLNRSLNSTPQSAEYSSSGTPNSSFAIRHSSFAKVYPDLALAMLRKKQTAAGRVWFLLRHLDAQGRGWVSVAEATRALTAGSAPLHICGRRQLSNLLKQGDGLYWDLSDLRGLGVNKVRQPLRSGDEAEPRIWLHSVARVAAALGVERLGTAPVAVDIRALTGTIGHVRAHLFASFHSGRQKTDFVTGRPRPRGPIARETLHRLSAACPNSQRAYERRAGVARKAAFAIGPEAPHGETQTAEAQTTAWQRGRSFFRLTDHHGRYGRPGRTYLAWQLPNEYTGPHPRLTRSRMKRMNRALADLLVNGMTGNDERTQGHQPPSKRFFGNAKAAWTAERQGKQGDDLYWRGPDGAWRMWGMTKVECRMTNGERATGSNMFNKVSRKW